MDIAQLAIRTGLPIRRLRYVFDHQILPGTRHAEGRGIPRSFLAFEGFGIALAALLLEAGLKRWLVALCFDAVQIGRSVPISQEPLYQGYVARSGWLEIGDGLY